MGNVLIASLGGLVLGYALAKLTDRVWLASASDDPRTETRDSLPLIAIGLAVMFAVNYHQHGVGVVFIKNCVFSAAMFLVERVNRRTLLVPNIVTIPGTAVGLVLSIVTPPGAVSALLGAVGGGGALFLMAEAYYRSTGSEGVGMGIVKLQALVGAFLGWQLAAVAFVLASMAGAVGSVLYVAVHRNEARQLSVPFGSYMALSAVIAATSGQTILNWYLSHFRQ